MNKWLNFLKWVFLIGYLMFIFGFTGNKKEALICNDYKIFVNGPHNFIDKEIVENLLINNDIKIDSCIIDNLNFDKIEKVIETHPAVLKSEVFSDYYGKISIEICQRNPVLRVITSDNTSFYIDSEGAKMPLSDNYTAHVPVLSGNIDKLLVKSLTNPKVIDRPDYKYSYSLNDLFEFTNYLQGHDLWQYQITHIYINNNRNIELVPRLGNQILILGDLENYSYKLRKLEILYRQMFHELNWDSYASIDLRYSDQVILKKR